MKSIIKNQKSKIKNQVSIALMIALVFSACELRILEDDFMETALIPVRIDWSVSGVAVEEIHRASVWLFPQEGGTPLEYRLESDVTYREIAVPVGVYSALIFNETIDPTDWNSLAFTGTKGYETFAAVNVPQSSIGFYERSNDLPLIGSPDAIAAWSLDRFEVTPEMIERTRPLTRHKTDPKDVVSDLTVAKPTPRFERVVITAFVTNLKSAKQATGTIDGINSGVYLATGKRMTKPAVQAFILNGRVYDGNDGTTTRTFNIFGKTKEQHIVLDFLLTNNELHPREEFDVTNLTVTQTIDNVNTHFINVGYGIFPGDHLITLPEGDMDPETITVDEWNEVIIPIK